MTDGGGLVQSRSRASVVASVAVAGLTVLVLLIAVWAASAGPDDPFRNGGEVVQRTAAPPVTVTETATPDDRQDDGQPPPRSSVATTVLGVVVLTIGVLVALGLLYLGFKGLRSLRGQGWRRRPPHETPQLDPLEPAQVVQSVVAAMIADADDHEDLLTGGTPRNAVVLCWHRFELQAERAGVPREPWETSSEYTLRLLDLVEADATSVARLSELYREARFSEHDLGEDARVLALDILRSIHRDLRTLLTGGRQ